MIISLPSIRHDKAGFESLVNLWTQTKQYSFSGISIDMSAVDWFDADMCAILGGILYRLTSNSNSINLINIHSEVESILLKNGFLSYYGHAQIPDCWGTTIPYKRFNLEQQQHFAQYIDDKLMNRQELPVMSKGLKKKFEKSLHEIFSNADAHSQTQHGIHCCGQFFPRRNRINFSITDLGIGMRQNIKEKKGEDLSPEDAIKWATSGNKTTKTGNIPGGLGLKFICDFIKLNHGHLQIVSDAGYWRLDKFQEISGPLSHPFPGTVVCLEINTADTNSYLLSTELTKTDLSRK